MCIMNYTKFLLCKQLFGLLQLCRQMPVKLNGVNKNGNTVRCFYFCCFFLVVLNFSLLILKIDFRLQTEHKLDMNLHVKDT